MSHSQQHNNFCGTSAEDTDVEDYRWGAVRGWDREQDGEQYGEQYGEQDGEQDGEQQGDAFEQDVDGFEQEDEQGDYEQEGDESQGAADASKGEYDKSPELASDEGPADDFDDNHILKDQDVHTHGVDLDVALC
ncbi:hypothetical protein BV22DRAFT_1188694 [Leucogyrophana mollusca]|uniref:Uncharacterized protein n=1 Tax=Leucogyrophana mollusca TaxID=85980 RepID=A0ACB8ATX1_9AGAM|nr:hypothetical protein BV22DRAFT_1188694 [Leucogyrophana mollusca]